MAKDFGDILTPQGYLKNEKNRKVITVSQMIASNKKGTKIPKRPSQRRNAPGLKRHALGYHP